MSSSEPSHRCQFVAPFLEPLEVATFAFSNGLELLVLRDDFAPVVTWQTWYRVGSACEEPGRTGLAHLFEHLMFKATEDYADGEFSARLEAAGAEGLNAWTWFDETVYTQSVPREALPLVAELEASRMARLALDEANLAQEREVVLNERRFRVDNDPGGRMAEALSATAFQVHPYRWPTIGWQQDIEALTLEDCLTFYRRWYAPDNATVVLVGDVDPHQAAERIAREFGSYKRGNADAPALEPEPPARASQQRELTLPMATDRVLVGYRAPAGTSEHAVVLRVIEAVLHQGMSGRLNRELVDRGLAVGVYASTPVFRDPGLFEIEAVGRPGVEAEVLAERIDGVLEQLAREPISAEELERAVHQLLAQRWEGLASATGRASFLGRSRLLFGDWRTGVERMDRLEQVTPEQVLDVASRVFDSRGRTRILGRAGLSAGAPAAEPGARLAQVSGRPVRSLPRHRAPAGAPAEDRGESQVLQEEGADLVRVYDPTSRLVEIHAAFPFGNAADPPGREGLVRLTAELMLRGTRTRSREVFEHDLEQIGGEMEVTVGPDRVEISGSVLREHWPVFYTLFREALVEPAFSEEDLEQLRSEMLGVLESARDDDRRLTYLAFREAIYGAGHPLAATSVGTGSGLRALTRDHVVELHAGRFGASGAVFGVAGAYDEAMEDDLAALARVLGPTDLDPPTWVLPPLAPGWRLVVVDKPDRNQSQVFGGHWGVSHLAPDYAAFTLGNELFGGAGFSSRLMREIREERGWSYGANAWNDAGRIPGPWAWWIFPAVDQTVPAITHVSQMLRELSEGVTSEEVDQARRILVNRRVFLRATVGARLAVEMERRLRGFDVLAWLDQVEHTDRRQVERALARHVHPDPHLVVLVTDAESVAPALESLGHVEVRDHRLVGQGSPS